LLRVPAGHYVYAERTQLTILPQPGLTVLDVQAPEPQTKHDTFMDEDVGVYAHDAEWVAQLRLDAPLTVVAVMETQGCSSRFCYFPQSDTLQAAIAVTGAGSGGATPGIATAPPVAGTSPAAPGTPGAAATAAPSLESDRLRAAADRGLVWLLLLAFGAGVATSFTPCVYPMIPITVGIIGARSAGRRSKGFTLSLLYVLGIAITYSVLGTSAALTGSLFGSVLQNPWVVIGVALVFTIMAMSLFGVFELQVPAAFAGRMNRVQGSGYPGALLLGLIAGIVASPCIGPVLVAMLAYVATSGNAWLGFGLFFTFALGLGMLFIVLGTFTGVLASLPKSGAWMVRVKIAFGIVFLGLALYYLHPFLPHDRSRLLPAGAALLVLGIVLGAFRTIEETEPPARRWRKAIGRAAVAFAIYALVMPLVLARLHPPVANPRWADSEPAGMQRAQTSAKPMLVDFSASWCGACKELERYTFSDPRVIALADQFVTVRIDATRDTPEIVQLREKYGIRGLPWVAFVAADGTILQNLTVTGFIDADAMLARMTEALPANRAAAP
jgi:thiol:disulfide interchange protein DsbD